ncbi:hypothetical protein B0H11DRAFT_2229525 [Mycena galericulata]|nr:hypothetical protein B0H11DRAFT_2229525 [Mycena galericulata]
MSDNDEHSVCTGGDAENRMSVTRAPPKKLDMTTLYTQRMCNGKGNLSLQLSRIFSIGTAINARLPALDLDSSRCFALLRAGNHRPPSHLPPPASAASFSFLSSSALFFLSSPFLSFHALTASLTST